MSSDSEMRVPGGAADRTGDARACVSRHARPSIRRGATTRDARGRPHLPALGGLAGAAFALLVAPLAWAATVAADDAAAGTLRVCADPNNLPFSNDKGEGFENALAELVARELGRQVAYTWWPQRRGFIRETLKAHRCDLVVGVPARFEMLEPTSAYYVSSYVFVTRRDRHLDIRALDDPRLKGLKIGIHAIGDDYSNVPPAQVLADHGLAANIRGYSIYGDYSKPNPPHQLIDAVARGEVDVAIAWGPLAGYYASREPVALDLQPVPDDPAEPLLPMRYAIAMGVRHGDDALREQVDAVLARRRDDILAVLRRYGVPLVAAPAAPKPQEP